MRETDLFQPSMLYDYSDFAQVMPMMAMLATRMTMIIMIIMIIMMIMDDNDDNNNDNNNEIIATQQVLHTLSRLSQTPRSTSTGQNGFPQSQAQVKHQIFAIMVFVPH